MKRRVVITGMGAVSPIGNNVNEMWDNAKKGLNGIDKITAFDTENFKVKVAGEVKGLDFTQYMPASEAKKFDRFVKLVVVAAAEAFADSKLDMTQTDPTRCGTLISSGIGGIDTIANAQVRGENKGYDRVSPYFIPTSITNMAAGVVAINHGLQGKCSCVVTACAGGTFAVGDGFHHIRDGYSDVMVCGGTESAITQLGIGGFTSLRALSENPDPSRACIPFDAERDGFVMGEGAGVLVLEELEHALARNATIYGEVVGYGSTCDAHHITAPDPAGTSAARCMREALADGNITPDQVDYINAHGTSTPLNDKGEVLAIKLALGEELAKKVAISSTKSMTGHLLGAAGAIEAIFSVKAIADGFIPPTINYKVPDENCDLDIVPNVGRAQTVEIAMSNSLGFGGHNATLVFAKYK